MLRLKSHLTKRVGYTIRCISSAPPVSPTNPESVCIIGSGPSGFYTLKYLLSHPSPPKIVDLVDSSRVPFGLIRTGVAPDHGDVKNAQSEFTQIIEGGNGSTGVRFLGGVAVGEGERVKLSDVEDHYDAVVLCHGASLSNELNLPAYKPDGSKVEAPPVVRPGFREVVERKGGEGLSITVIGGGNVSLDLARVFAKGRRGILGESEVRDEEIKEMAEWGVGTIGLYNRRGAYQTAFTTKEFRDIYKMAKAGKTALRVDLEDIERSSNKESLEEMEGNRPMTRLIKLITQVAEDDGVKKGEGTQISVKYLRSPSEIHTDEEGNMMSVRFELQELSGEKGAQRAVGTGVFEDVQTDVLVSSMGYKASPLDQRLPFEGGRYKHERGHVEGRVFAAGWCKRGPKGIVGTNITDARETVGRIYEGTETERGEVGGDFVDFLEKEGVEYSTWEGWQRVDEVERDEDRLREGQARNKIKDEDEIRRVAMGR
ncbi:hypothetical protein TrRE_jg13288 [Triparma retinervis]|uniref:FAD/NAD(P)-binding domain-containing protein n=1 Tax=Triparma retinervis TaxID=2557542 RepID=A0A9W7A3F5_9STRA|nr:hypothetical protein TrRE_jg13288 [Triparma retinervis]